MPSLLDWLRKCEVCPNFCRVDRTSGSLGRCRTDDSIVLSASNLHFGEEPCLVGTGGSGTIFLTSCNLSCVFCQNYDISQLDRGTSVSPGELLRLVRSLEIRGAENINLVSPTHQAPQLFEAIRLARKDGLVIPVVYNCGGYENPDFLRELDGLVDIYMPDFKYGNNESALAYSGVNGYGDYCRASLREMRRQVGDLELDSNGVAIRGLLVRHLVLPRDVAGTRSVIDFIAEELSPATYLNIMDQYHPSFRAREYRELSARVPRSEVDAAVAYAHSKGMSRVLS
jgi:putative pyruvate formate lyase activating enzyme